MAYVLRLLLDSADVSRLGGEYRRRQEPPTESSQPTEVTPIDRALVKGHDDLPSGGRGTCPLTVIGSAR
jgi:hypothetical protein